MIAAAPVTEPEPGPIRSVSVLGVRPSDPGPMRFPSMASPKIAVPNRFITFATFVLVIAVLRIAEDVMIPIALALLLAFLLTPLVLRLTRWKLPRPFAILVTVGLAFVVISAAGWQIANQAVSLLSELPGYESNLQKKISVLKKPQATGTVSRAVNTFEKMWADLQTTATPPPSVVDDGKPKPTPVEVKATNRTSFELAREVLGRLFKPLGTAGIVAVFVIAILFQRDDLRNRFIRVISGGQLNIATEAVDDAAQRVSRYLLAQLMVNTCFGIVIALGLWMIGVPHAGLWGLLATMLRFIPFLGPMIAAGFPLLLAIAIDPGWTMLFWTAGLFLAAELVTNNVIEVLVYGTSTGISTLALLIAAVFWSWLWGMAGLFLSTPLTVCLLVIGQYVPGLKFLSVLLGSEPPLQPSAQFYQAMLSMNQEDLFDLAAAHVEQHSLTAFYDDVFVPALLMSEVDRHNGVLAEMRQKFIFESGRELIEDLGEQSANTRRAADEPPPAQDRSLNVSPRVIGVPARDEADELVAMMLAHLLQEHGITTRVISTTADPETYRSAIRSDETAVFISALPPSTLSAASRACRRIKQENVRSKVLVGVWSADGKLEPLRHRLDPAGADGIVTRLSEAVVQVKNLLVPSTPANVPVAETENAHILERTETKLVSKKPEEAAETITRELARAFDVPISLVSVIQTDREFWQSSTGSHPPMTPAENSVHDAVLGSDELLLIEDVSKDERFANLPQFVKRGVRAFATMPLRLRNGHLVGNLCILDTQPRSFRDGDRELLESLATQFMESIEPADSAAPETSAAL